MTDGTSLHIQSATLRERVRAAFGFGTHEPEEKRITVTAFEEVSPQVTVEELETRRFRIGDRYKESRPS